MRPMRSTKCTAACKRHSRVPFTETTLHRSANPMNWPLSAAAMISCTGRPMPRRRLTTCSRATSAARRVKPSVA
eukprot:2408622-Lingulodinium_polyedra.AAC.1